MQAAVAVQPPIPQSEVAGGGPGADDKTGRLQARIGGVMAPRTRVGVLAEQSQGPRQPYQPESIVSFETSPP